jgi:hypothetical protein
MSPPPEVPALPLVPALPAEPLLPPDGDGRLVGLEVGLEVGLLGADGPPEVVAQPASVTNIVNKEITRNALIRHL